VDGEFGTLYGDGFPAVVEPVDAGAGDEGRGTTRRGQSAAPGAWCTQALQRGGESFLIKLTRFAC
jgi:hypothetical protein